MKEILMRNSVFLFLLAISFVCDRCQSAERPNFIVIFTDDHGYADLSAQGVVPDIRTPHIDALAAGGVRMTSGYCSAPQCVPSRAGLLTGRYQNRFGVESNKETLEGFAAQQTIAERLKEVGYATGMIGKWHLGPAGEITSHGFDDVFYQGGSWINFDFAGKRVEPGSKNNQMYHLDAGSAAAKAFIHRHHAEPFFLYLAYRAPHVPLDATKKYLDRFPGNMPQRRRQALAMLSAVDDGVGGVMDALREHGIEENTLIFFIGDNGAPLKIHKLDAPGGGPGWDGSLNDPMNGEKGMLSEGGIRVPFVVYWKGRIDGGQTFHHPVISLDAAGTILPLAGCPDESIDGVNLLPCLTGQTAAPPHQHLYWRWISQSAVRQGDWKLLRGGDREYLFDLSKDKEEQHSVLKQHPEIADALRSKLKRWSAELDPPGLSTGEMSMTWEQYFDFYLDGKPAPPLPRRKLAAAGEEKSYSGWVLRNGRATLNSGGLQIRPTRDGKGVPFIAKNALNCPGPLTVEVRIATREAGKLSVAWRAGGDKGFPADQVATVACAPGESAADYQIKIPTGEKVIHLRLILPPEGADLESIAIRDQAGVRLHRWGFGR
jgi:uncharacterized sulfatase